MRTPFFPAFRPRLAARKAARPAALPRDASALQALLQGFFPRHFLAQADQGCNSRSRCWTLELTFWTFLWQVLHPRSSCRQAVHAAGAALRQWGFKKLTEEAFCKARQRLPLETIQRIDQAVREFLRRRAATACAWKGFQLKVVDGSSSSMPDTALNQQKWPQPSGQKAGCGFPVVKWVGLFCLASGALLGKATGTLKCHELRLFKTLLAQLEPGDLLVADRGFSAFGLYALLQGRSIETVFRFLGGKKSAPGKRSRLSSHRRLGPGDEVKRWKKPYVKPAWLTLKEWRALPAEIEMRFITFTAKTRGWRDQTFVLATSLLDPEPYPAREIIALFLRRWEVEGFIGQMKTELQMEVLRCQSPAMIEKELVMHRLAYNLCHALMAESADRHQVPCARLSFAGALSAIQAAITVEKTRSRTTTRNLYHELLELIARELVPKRPGRKEPRAVKRRPKPFQLLNKPRHLFEETPHRAKYTLSRP